MKNATVTHFWQAQSLDLSPVAPAVYIGTQEGIGEIPSFDLYNLTETISPALVEGSTVSGATLTKVGFRLPAR